MNVQVLAAVDLCVSVASDEIGRVVFHVGHVACEKQQGETK